MGRKKIDKESLEYLTPKLFHKDIITGFQFTAGNSPLGIKENRPLQMYCSINKSQSNSVIDGLEGGVGEKISEYIFGKNHTVSLDKIRDYQKQFRDLGYEVEEADFVGQWYWFRVKCKWDEIINHVNILKEKIVI